MAANIVKGHLGPSICTGKAVLNNQRPNMQGKGLHHNSGIERVVRPSTLNVLTSFSQKGFDPFTSKLKTALVRGIFILALLTKTLDFLHFLRSSFTIYSRSFSSMGSERYAVSCLRRSPRLSQVFSKLFSKEAIVGCKNNSGFL